MEVIIGLIITVAFIVGIFKGGYLLGNVLAHFIELIGGIILAFLFIYILLVIAFKITG